jgi:hypothetical protein
MLLFRSEEHLGRWLDERGLARGATLTLEQQWRLAKTWYGGRLERDWRRRSPDEAQGIFTEIGLTGDFWTLVP